MTIQQLKSTLGISPSSTLFDGLLSDLLEEARQLVQVNARLEALDDADPLHRRAVLLEAAALWADREAVSEKQRHDGPARRSIYKAIEIRRRKTAIENDTGS